MEKRTFGSWTIGGSGWRLAWGPQVDDETVGSAAAELRFGEDELDRIEAFLHENPQLASSVDGLPPARGLVLVAPIAVHTEQLTGPQNVTTILCQGFRRELTGVVGAGAGEVARQA